jgi:hypothetical protein
LSSFIGAVIQHYEFGVRANNVFILCGSSVDRKNHDGESQEALFNLS